MASADLNGDGKLDLVTNYSLGISVLLNDGNGTFATTTWNNVRSSAKINVTDMNDDGHPDILGIDFYSYDGPDVIPFVLINSGNGVSFDRRDIPVPITTFDCCLEPKNIFPADFDGNGFVDFAYSYNNKIIFNFSQCWQ